MRRVSFLTLALCLLFFALSPLSAQVESRLAFRRYTTQDGLPQMQTERLWQDSRGYIYVGTLSGFVRFDGRSFTPFLRGRRTNIVGFAEVDREVRALGFFRQWTVGYDDLKAQPLDPQGHWLLNNLNAGSLPNGYVLVEDSLEEHRRLCRLTRTGLEPVLADPLLDRMTPDRKACFDPSTHEGLIPTEQGVFLLSAAQAQSDYQTRKGASKARRLTDRGDIYTLLPTDSALLAFASDGIYALAGDSLRLLARADWSAASYGLTVRRLQSGGLVIADEHSVYLWNAPSSSILTLSSGINLIRDLLVDRWDRLWVATYQGLYCFFNRGFTNHQLEDPNDIVRAVAADDAGHLVMGTLNGKVIVSSSLLSDDPEQFYAPSAVAIGNKVYMAGNGDVFCVDAPADNTSRLHGLGLPRDRYQFVASAWGRLIIGSRNAILAYDPARQALDTLTTDILHPWCAVQGAEHRLWVGSSSGLFAMAEDGTVVKKDYPQKLIVSTIDADRQGAVFFASADSVFVVRHGEIESLNLQLPRLAGHEVRSLHVSPRGYLVVATVDGLFVSRIDKDCRLSNTRFFNHLNGFTQTEPLKAVMAETADGTVWLPGIEEMTSFRPADLLAYSEEDTYIAPPLRWWQHWWVWLTGLLLLSLAIWGTTRWYEKRRNRRRLIRLEWEKQQRERQIDAIRQKAMESETENPLQQALAQDIVKMTEKAMPLRLTLRTVSGTIVVDTKEIAYFKADGNYSQIVAFHTSDTVLISLGALEKMLSPDVFVRADRSTLVNIHHISALLPKQHRCVFRSPSGEEVETTLLAPAFRRLKDLL
ncbi:MAG: LytTR family transcriptional regulator DNA-binding domain-containing protein [Bacteroidaceae bacterium]|nr:LytTR family transcriptional regulator DNA-binding domain-containing protein [Bacteroidaceae bacterium]